MKIKIDTSDIYRLLDALNYPFKQLDGAHLYDAAYLWETLECHLETLEDEEKGKYALELAKQLLKQQPKEGK